MDLASILLVKSVQTPFSWYPMQLFSSVVVVVCARGLVVCLTHCWSVLVHSALFPKGLYVSWVFSGGSAVPELQIKGCGLSLEKF